MTKEGIDKLLSRGECIEIEFKESFHELNKDTFDSICAFLNRNGGHLLLGVTNKGEVNGVLESAIPTMVNNIVTNLNNPGRLNPTFYLEPKVLDYSDDKKIIYVHVPESSLVHRLNGKIFDRAEDADIDITANSTLVTQLYVRKQNSYSENKIYPKLLLEHFRLDLLQRVRKLVSTQKANHSWLEMTDFEIMKSASLHKHDYQTGEEGFTLAAVLLLGRDEVIQSIIPDYRTDAIVRINGINRYDDRDDIRTNLIESYDRLMAFVSKHLPDRFYQQGTERISLRDIIFREIVANLLVHREFTSGFPAKLIIGQDTVETENWNKPHGNGSIDPNMFSPYPKNPNIANFFKQIGRVEELGSGIRNVFKYSKLYSGKEPRFEEGDIFKASIPNYRVVPSPPTNVKVRVITQLELMLEKAYKRSLERTQEALGRTLNNTLEGTQDNTLEGTQEAVERALDRALSKVYEQVDSEVKDTDNQQVKIRLVKELVHLKHARGLRGEVIQTYYRIGRTAYQRDMKRLREAGWIEFKGGSAQGKYVLTDKGQELLKEIPDVNESINQ